LTKIFVYTDPDLELSPTLPKTFLDNLLEIQNIYKTYKVGCALTLLYDEDTILNKTSCITKKPFRFNKSYSIFEWEQQFWTRKLENNNYTLYSAALDTTFAIYNKENYRGNFFDGIRVAGNFSAIHLPWYPKFDLMNISQKKVYLHNNKSTTWV
jgi:hypothetical protein